MPQPSTLHLQGLPRVQTPGCGPGRFHLKMYILLLVRNAQPYNPQSLHVQSSIPVCRHDSKGRALCLSLFWMYSQYEHTGSLSPVYRGTSLTRNRTTLGPYSRPMPRALWWSYGGWRCLMREVPLYKWESSSSEAGGRYLQPCTLHPSPYAVNPAPCTLSAEGGGYMCLSSFLEGGVPHSTLYLMFSI